MMKDKGDLFFDIASGIALILLSLTMLMLIVVALVSLIKG